MNPKFKIKNLIIISLFFFVIGYLSFVIAPQTVSAATIKAPPSNLGLVGYWPMNEGTGTIAGDFSGNGNSGTLTGGPTWATGKRGGALSFSGSNYIGTAADPTSLQITTGTISVWFNTTGIVRYDGMVSYLKDYATGLYGYAFGLREGGLAYMVADSTGYYEGFGISSVSLNTWHHGVFVFSPTNIKLYLDSTLVGNVTPTKTAQFFSGNNARVGHMDNNTLPFNGKLDDVRIYSRALSAGEITTLYGAKEAIIGKTQSTGSLATGLVGHWSFDGGKTTWTSSTAGTITDSSGNSNTGTITNATQSAFPTDGVIGQAGNFDGSNDYVSIGTGINTALNDNYTVAFWTKLRGTSALFGDRGTTGSHLITYNTHVSNDLSFHKEGFNDIQDVPFSQYLNTWAHVVWVYDKDNSLSKVYINGVQQSSVSYSSFTTYSGSNFIGDDSANFLQGAMDDVRVYSRVLTTAEITRLYNLGRPTVLSVNRSPILDNFSNAAIAYSLRKLSSTYTGYAINVRRTAGGTQDIGFVGNNLDTATLASFCASDDCYVVTWYDQSGNGKNITQASTTRQPQIVSAGTILTGANSKPIMSFDGSDDDLQNTSIGSFAQPRMVSTVMSATNAEYGAYPWTNAVTGGGYSWNGGLAGFGNLAFSISNSGGGACCSKTFVSGTNYIYQAYYNTSSSVTRLSNGANTTGSLSNDTITGFILGGFYEGGTTGHFATFKMSEFILWNMTADQSTRDTILRNQNNYYAIY